MKALLIIDMQNDFMPDGTLAVEGSDTLIPTINSMMDLFPLVIASMDFHPDHHISFAATHSQLELFQKISFKDKLLKVWPKHCVQGTSGVELAKDLNKAKIDAVFYKGDQAHMESFSIFFDLNGEKASSCHDFLEQKGVDTLYICGVASEYCVFESAKDAHKLGYRVYVVTDACKGVDKKEELLAFEELSQRGVGLIKRKDIQL